MYEGHRVNVVIPALNEAAALPKVLTAIPAWVDQVIVADNGSTDATADVAAAGGATVAAEPRRGYGQACLTALAAMAACDVVVFLDGDFSDDPTGMADLVAPIAADRADMVLGSRVAEAEAGSLTGPQRFGNGLACRLMQLMWRHRYTDLGPFRAIRATSLGSLGMVDTNYGWTIEMQIKAIRAGLRIAEVAVPYRMRIGRSKVSGTLRGVVGAGTKILWTLFRYAVAPPPKPRGDRLIVFGRFPMPGEAKTRLIGSLGATGAAWCQRRMTEYVARAAADSGATDLEFAYEGGTARAIRRWLGPAFTPRRQGCGGLGGRMARCLQRGFTDRCGRVVLIGTDCPGVTAPDLDEALAALDDHDVVLGPTGDGGYYLVGMRSFVDVFTGITFSTPSVLADTLALARSLGLSVYQVGCVADIDRAEDLKYLPPPCRPAGPYVSVVIPALNEEDLIGAAVTSARADGAEVLVVDGGSSDHTVEQARAAGARILHAPPGRASQMNAGVAASCGDIVLLLHGDSVLPSGYVDDVFEAMSDPQVVGGAFCLASDSDHPAMRIIIWCANLRSRYAAKPYGDQGIFVRRAALAAAGGVPDVPIAEDLRLIGRLRKIGRLRVLGRSVITSSRRWASVGILRTTIINQLILIGLALGASGHRLARLYGRLRVR